MPNLKINGDREDSGDIGNRGGVEGSTVGNEAGQGASHAGALKASGMAWFFSLNEK